MQKILLALITSIGLFTSIESARGHETRTAAVDTAPASEASAASSAASSANAKAQVNEQLDFGPYMKVLAKQIRLIWRRSIADELPCHVLFTVGSDGRVLETRIIKSSKNQKYDADCLATIKKAQPFAPLPPGAPASVQIDFSFGEEKISHAEYVAAHKAHLASIKQKIAELTDAILRSAANPNPGFYIERGHLFLELSNRREALKDFDEAIKINPGYDFQKALDLKAKLYESMGQYWAAIAEFSKIIAIAPGNANAYWERANQYEHLCVLWKARPDLSKALELDPKNQIFLRRSAQLNIELKNFAAALEDLNKLLAQSKDNADDLGMRGDVYGFLGEFDKAKEDYKTASKVDPERASSWGDRFSSRGDYPNFGVAYFIDKLGRRAIATNYQGAGDFKSGLAPVRTGAKVDFIDRSGRIIIHSRGATALEFNDGIAQVLVPTEDKRWHTWKLIGKKGATLKENIDFWTLEGRVGYSEDLMPVAVGRRAGFVDKEFKLVIAPLFNGAAGFSQRMARVLMGSKYGYIGKDGNFIIQPKYRRASSFSEGLAAVSLDCDKSEIAKRHSDKPSYRYGYINTKDELILTFTVEKPPDVYVPYDPSHPESGLDRLTVDPPFDLDGVNLSFSEGLAAAPQGNKFGYINKQGAFVIAPRFDGAMAFHEGLAAVRINNDWGYIDRTGRLIVPAKYCIAREFSQGLAAVYLSTAPGPPPNLVKSGKQRKQWQNKTHRYAK